MRGAVLFLAALLAGPGSLAGQAGTVRYRMQLVDLVMVADTSYGLQVLVQPAERTVAEGTAGALVWLQFHPDSVLAWLNAAAAILRFPAPGGPVEAIQWSPTLRPLTGSGGFLLGRQRKKGTLQKARWLAVADSAPGWQAEIAAAEADSVLRLFLALGARARMDSSAGSVDRVDRPATIEQQQRPGSRGGRGLVAVQYVVDATGRVEPASISVLLASSPRLDTEARELLLASRFTPARLGGDAVRQVRRQVLRWP